MHKESEGNLGTFCEKYTALCEKYGEKPTTVLGEIGISKSAWTKWKNGSVPEGDTIRKLASYFAEQVLKSVIQGLQNALKNVEVKAAQHEQDNTADKVKALTAQLNREQAKLRRIYESYESGVYSPDEFLSRRQQAQSAIAKVQQAIDQVNSITSKVNHDDQIKKLHDVIAMLGDDSIPARERNRFAKSIIKTIWYNNDGNNMTLDIETL